MYAMIKKVLHYTDDQTEVAPDNIDAPPAGGDDVSAFSESQLADIDPAVLFVAEDTDDELHLRYKLAAAGDRIKEMETKIKRLQDDLTYAKQEKNTLLYQLRQNDAIFKRHSDDEVALYAKIKQLQADLVAARQLQPKVDVAALQRQLVLVCADNEAIRQLHDSVSPVPICGHGVLQNRKPDAVSGDDGALSPEQLREALASQRELMRSMQAVNKHLVEQLRRKDELHTGAVLSYEDLVARKNKEIDELKRTTNKAARHKAQRTEARAALASVKDELTKTKLQLAMAQEKIEKKRKSSAEASDHAPSASASNRRPIRDKS
jgi:hypothetical protein